jgi:hypothetical protein
MPRGSGARSGKQAASRPAPRKAIVTRVVVPAPVKQVYKIVQARTGQVGGYGHDGPVYGEITTGSMQKIVDFLKKECGFNSESLFVDVGAGLGKPNFHVAVDPGVRLSVGIEVEQLRWLLSLKNLQALNAKGRIPPKTVCMLHRDVTTLGSFDPFTVVYEFDVGFPPKVLVSIANAFNRSITVKNLVSFKPPRDIIDKYGFSVRLVGGLTTSMAGSSETHKVYFYETLLNLSSSPKEKISTKARHTQLQISSIFTKSKKRGILKLNPEAEKAGKKRKLANISRVAVAPTSVELRGGLDDESETTLETEGASPVEFQVDDAFKEAFDLLKDEEESRAWVAKQIDGFFGGGRQTRKTKRTIN